MLVASRNYYLHLKLLGQSITDLNYRARFGNEEKEGSYNHYNKDFASLRENKYLNIKMLPKQTTILGFQAFIRFKPL